MTQSSRTQLFLLVLFFLSGATGLIYEVVWQRMLILVFGNTTYATTTVVASFLGGMAAGSFYFGRFADRSKSPLRLYACLEAGIAIFAILSPVIISAMPAIYVGLDRNLPVAPFLPSLTRLALSFLVLLVPSFLMGGTLPVIARFFIQRFERLGWGVGVLYGVNTLGGVVGAFCAAFIFLTWLGVRETIYVAAAVNILIVALVLVIDRYHARPHPVDRVPTCPPVDGGAVETAGATIDRRAHRKYMPQMLLTVYAISGFCSLAYEVLWTRVLVFSIGSNTHAFATMLTTFLLGLGLGSLLFGRVFDKTRRLFALLAAVQVLIGLSAMLSVWQIDNLWTLLDFLEPKIGGSWAALVGVRYLGAAYIMFIPTLLLGMTFPLVNKLYTRDLDALGRSIGKIWSVNAVGWVAGAFTAGLLLIPWIGISKSIMTIASLNIVLGAIVAFSILPTKNTIRWAPVAAALILGVVIVLTIAIPRAKLQRIQPGENLLYYKEDSSASVAVVERFGVKTLKVNGREEVPTTYNALRTFHMLGHLPLMLHGNPQQTLVVSFGAGVASGAVAEHDIRQLDIVEIHHEAIDASNSFLEENQAVLSDPRVNLIVDDGRNYLLRTTKQYDVITSDATHPLGGDSWVLYTKEFYELCRDRLAQDGLMAQWLPIHMLAPDDYRSVIKTFQSVFSDTSLWYTNDYTLMLGAKDGLTIDFALLKEKFQDEKVRQDLEEFNLGTPLALLGTFVMGKESLVEHTSGTEVNTDNHPFIEPPRRRTDLVAAPQNLIDLEQSVESVFPLLTNMGNEADAIRSGVEQYVQSQKRVIRGNFYKSVGARTQESREYQAALYINPSDSNARHLLESVSMFR